MATLFTIYLWKISTIQNKQELLKCHGGSTKGLHVRIKSTHHMEIKQKRKNPVAPDSENDSQAKRTMITTIDHFVKESTLPAVLGRMTACDGLTFNILVTSQDLRKSLKALGHSLPKSVTGIIEQ